MKGKQVPNANERHRSVALLFLPMMPYPLPSIIEGKLLINEEKKVFEKIKKSI